MAEEEVQYASVVFKNKKQPKIKSQKEEEVVYDKVKVRNETSQQSSDSKGLLSEKEAERKSHYCQTLACCLGTFCIILVLGIIGVTVYLVLFHEKDLNKLKVSEAENKNLTALNSRFRSDKENLTDRIGNLMQDYTVLEMKIGNLTAENQELKTQNQELEEEKKTLKQQIEILDKRLTELDVSEAQRSIDAYCPKETTGRKCKPCQNGWNVFESSCYAYNNAKDSEQRTWDEAQKDCIGKSSHLTVVTSQQEKDYVNRISPAEQGIAGFWIGLKVVETKWKWINGTELSNQTWMSEAAVGDLCVTSLQDRGWKAERCDQKMAWICAMKALSVK